MARPAGFSSDEDYDDEIDDFVSVSNVPGNGPREQPPPPRMENSPDHQLFLAVLKGDFDQVKRLIDEGADINYIRPDVPGDWSLLMHACQQGDPRVVELLLKLGMDPKEIKHMFTPLMALCNSSNTEENLLRCFSLLILHGADLNARDWFWTPLVSYAAKNGRAQLIKRILALRPEDLESKDTLGNTPLAHAVTSGHIEAVKTLLAAGANRFAHNKQGLSMYDLACSFGHYEVAELLKTDNDDSDEYEVSDEEEKPSNNYMYVLSQLPDPQKGKFDGFTNDALQLLRGIGLGRLDKIFMKHNVSLGQFLTFTNEQWEEIGIDFKCDLKRINNAVCAFHEHPWKKESLGILAEKTPLSLFQCLQVVANLTRQFSVMNASIYYWRTRFGDTISEPESHKLAQQTLYYTEALITQFRCIIEMAKEIDREQSINAPDLIGPKCQPSKLALFGKIIFISVSCGIVCYKRPSFVTKVLPRFVSRYLS